MKSLHNSLGDVALRDSGRRACLEAALCLLAGDWEQAHRLCQDVPTLYGSAWHGVVHRLEGDYWNSNYWWRRARGIRWDAWADDLQRIVAAAPVEVAREMAGWVRGYDPTGFVGLVERHHEHAAWKELLVDVQRWEWAALFSETAEL